MVTLRDHLTTLARPIVVVVTGGRHYADVGILRWALEGLHRRYGIAFLHAGDATGADALALEWARERGVPCEEHEAKWSEAKPRRAAGPIRNGVMLRKARPDLVVAFPGNEGTADCKSQAQAMNLVVWEVG